MINRTYASKILIVIGALFVAFVIVEFSLRIMNYQPRFMEMDMFVEQDNELLPYVLKPHYNGYQVGKEVTLDSEGNRVINPSPRHLNNQSDNDNSDTILVLGDSVVFGFGLADDETIASQLQLLINERGADYTVKNIGAPGYTSWNEYEALNQYLIDHNVDIVVLLYVFNDITKNNNALVDMQREQEIKYSSLKKILYKNIYLLSLIKEIKASNSIETKSIRNTDVDTSIMDQLKSTYLNQEAVNYSMQAISKIQSICEQNKTELIVVIPRFHMWFYNFPEFSDNFEADITSKLNNIGVENFIATSHVEKLSIEEINVYKNDYHPSALAVSYLAADIYDEIENKKY